MGAQGDDEKIASSSKLKSAALLDMMKEHIKGPEGKGLLEKIGLVYQMNIGEKKLGFQEESFVIDLKEGNVYKGAYKGGKPDATFSLADQDFVAVATGKLNPQMAFIRGKMRIKGSMKAAQKFTPDIFPKPSKL
eukprot:TRINITY_DN15764_c0_g1_i1.p1 TRINITY_DN15764_c0_g1~~TRINITY_DN15764_c0_g1_i1.p1  ORF type:complete len:134 (+),score=32.33 TRINITY_DN15764_c0_g1_i1:308-709(+)